MDVILQKKELRKKMLNHRANILKTDKQIYDDWICNQLKAIISTQNYKTVHAYLPIGNEINITPLLSYLLTNNITVVTPKTLPKRKLENRILTSLNDIEKGVYGTTHPASPKEYKGDFDLIIVPGLAFDNNKFRLGYGGGYYDGFLSDHPKAAKIGIFYPFQNIEKVPTEPHDIKLDRILFKEF